MGSTMLYDPADLGPFRLFAIVVAGLAMICFAYTGRVVAALAPSVSPDACVLGDEASEDAPSNLCSVSAWRQMVRVSKEIVCARDFCCFVSVNFFQIFNLTLNDSFYVILVPVLLGGGGMTSAVVRALAAARANLAVVSHVVSLSANADDSRGLLGAGAVPVFAASC